MTAQCKIDECKEPRIARDLCSSHYQQAKWAGTLDEISPTPYTHCQRDGCDEPIPKGRRWGAMYHSAECKQQAIDDLRHAALLQARANRARLCAWCKEPLSLDRREGSRFCSKEHKDEWGNHQKKLAAERAKKAARNPCEVCGEPIPEDRRANAIYCSEEHKKLGRRTISPKARRDQAAYNRWYLYGITDEQWETQLAAQDYRCAICRTDDWGGRHGKPHTDHDSSCCPAGRACGKCFRGILCDDCNRSIGIMRHDSARLRAAADYLDEFAARRARNARLTGEVAS